MQWGKEKANEWLVTFVLSFFQSVIVVQPIKVINLFRQCRQYKYCLSSLRVAIETLITSRQCLSMYRNAANSHVLIEGLI